MSSGVEFKKEVGTMAWGIMMTALMLLGMFGVAIFEATYKETPTKPNLKHHLAGKDLKKVA
jgi:hypothetical protein